jgi:SAM-dependent methyltransferase
VSSEGEEVLPNWHHDFFRGVALEMWRRAVSPEQTRAEAEFLQRALKLPAAGRVVDVPCGNGRHSIALARQGHHVTGVDASEEFIAEARASGDSLPATWIVGDMRDLPWTGEFDGAFCFGNSFGYLDPSAARAFIAAVARTLKPGGRFAIETGMAAESILPGRVKTRWFRLGDLYMLSENEYDPREGRLDIQYTFIRDGVTETRPSSSYVLTANEICRMHAEAGMTPVDLIASVNGEAYDLGSPRLILVSEKCQESAAT